MDKPMNTTASQVSENAGLPDAYEAPRILTHSAADLDGMTLHVNACTSAFGASKSSDDSKDEESVVY
ncbi:MAG: hypothetical protein PWP23_969 [Candidatus Sumerlaeota bacterium]|nr:hypothetical protein [Candidatus Sumerlaeota bacterium]